MSSGPPAMPRRRPARSATEATVEPAGTITAPATLEKGMKVQSAPEARCRATHSQSTAMVSTWPACKATCVA
ncbi:hypothetical protein [Nitrospirillum sp. BR 11828]|uniref:hypothetical protein n=1 Tax=Nitrospirillum sp. BR 11828 TaxID=3104325 RepID=UPI002ACAD8FC|nr:hypothetical protein [Nitrospirillum sp. BR 11828]MDZ5645884.1 hypothetical protein [Nitrospirillum sp. BR 11828]